MNLSLPASLTLPSSLSTSGTLITEGYLWKQLILSGLMFQVREIERGRGGEKRARARERQREQESDSESKRATASARAGGGKDDDSQLQKKQLYYECAFLALDAVSPVTHSIGNNLKRIVIVVTSVIIFGQTMSTQVL